MDRAQQAAQSSFEGEQVGLLEAIEVRALLKTANLRPTRQRLVLGRILFADRHRHVAAEDLHRAVLMVGGSLSLATVYNTLRHFCEAGLIRQVTTSSGRTQYDTSASDHQHFYVEDEDRLIDIPPGAIRFGRLPEPPDGYVITAIDVLVRLRRLAPTQEIAPRMLEDQPQKSPSMIAGDAR